MIRTELKIKKLPTVLKFVIGTRGTDNSFKNIQKSNTLLHIKWIELHQLKYYFFLNGTNMNQYRPTCRCGDGNMAKFKNELGLFRNTDICCKQHDSCPAFIKSNSEFKGLRNTGLFTRSHCDCDWKFYNCLKRTNSLISNKIGYTYFNILRPPCFRKEYPIVGCRKWYS